MAIAFDAATSNTASATSVTVSHTSGGSADYAVVSVVAADITNITGVTYGGIAMTKLREADNASTVGVNLWGLANIPTGAKSVVVSSSASVDLIATAMTFSGVKQTASVEASASQTANNDSPATNITTLTNGAFVVDGLATLAAVTAAPDSGNERGDATSGAIRGACATEIDSIAGSFSKSWTLSGPAVWAHALVALKPGSSVSGSSAKVLRTNRRRFWAR